MESYLISPASGGVFMECFQRDGTEQTKELSWERRSGSFAKNDRRAEQSLAADGAIACFSSNFFPSA